MIANARMYSVTAAVGALWQRLFAAIAAQTSLPITVFEHREPEPIAALWGRPDKAAVFMCGLPFSRAEPKPSIVAAPVPAAAPFAGEAVYCSEWVVRAQSRLVTLGDTFGGRLGLTTPESQSGCLAALHDLMRHARPTPLYREVIAPQITPQGAVRAVLENRADVAPIDSFAYALLRRHEPTLTDGLRVIGRTARTPIPPIVGSQPGLESLTAAFIQADERPATRELMSELLIERFVLPEAASYDVLRQRFEAVTRFWREHPLASAVHPAFAALTSSGH
jgi:ABC-type phosphate/phosphonate transport system substrate-binding protein